MRAILVAIFAATALTACSDATSSATVSKIATNRVLPGGPSVLGAGRFLRTEKLTEDSEERATFDFVNKLKNLVKPKSVSKVVPGVIAKESQQLQTLAKEAKGLPTPLVKLLKAQGSTDEAFSALKIMEGGTNLFRRDALPTYVRYSQLASKQTGSKDIYGVGTLLKHFTDSELTKIVNAGMKSTDDLTQATADRLRAGQFGTWLRERKDPRDVYQLLKGGAKISEADRVNWRKYLKAFNDIYIKNAA